MPHTVTVVCRPEIAAGFALAGLRPVEVETPEECAAQLRDLLARPESGVVLIEDTYYERLPDELRRKVSRRPLPLVVPFPGPTWEEEPEGAEAYIVELLRQVIGYRVRLR